MCYITNYFLLQHVNFMFYIVNNFLEHVNYMCYIANYSFFTICKLHVFIANFSSFTTCKLHFLYC